MLNSMSYETNKNVNLPALYEFDWYNFTTLDLFTFFVAYISIYSYMVFFKIFDLRLKTIICWVRFYSQIYNFFVLTHKWLDILLTQNRVNISNVRIKSVVDWVRKEWMPPILSQ